MSNRLDLTGVFPPIPTPFNQDGEIELARLESNLEQWEAWPLSGYVVGGSNGEFVLLDDDERVAVVKAARQSIPQGKLLIAGSGAQSTRRTRMLTERMAEVGAEAALIFTPSYYRRQSTAAAMIAHYSNVADHSPIPILLYNVPANTGLNLPIEAVIELAKHPQIIGMKDSSGDLVRIASILEATGDDFQVLAGSASFYLAALSLGAVGVVAALANLAGHHLAKLQEAYRAKEQGRAAEIQLSLLAANHAVTARFGVAGLKAGLDMMGFYGGPVRLPLLPLSPSDREELKAILEDAAILV